MELQYKLYWGLGAFGLLCSIISFFETMSLFFGKGRFSRRFKKFAYGWIIAAGICFGSMFGITKVFPEKN